MHEISGHHSNTAVGDIVVVTVDSSHSYGVNFVPDGLGFGANIGSWTELTGVTSVMYKNMVVYM